MSLQGVAEGFFCINLGIFIAPPPPVIAWIKPSTILALILWKVNGTGGYNIQHFTAEYRQAFTNHSWITLSPTNIMPNSVSVLFLGKTLCLKLKF